MATDGTEWSILKVPSAPSEQELTQVREALRLEVTRAESAEAKLFRVSSHMQVQLETLLQKCSSSREAAAAEKQEVEAALATLRYLVEGEVRALQQQLEDSRDELTLVANQGVYVGETLGRQLEEKKTRAEGGNIEF